MKSDFHIPVLLEETIAALNLKASGIYVDATTGTGGHAQRILLKMPSSRLIAIDCDEEALEIAKKRLAGFDVKFIKGRFSNIKDIVHAANIDEVDGIIIDLGLSKIHLSAPKRGFSFFRDDPLDMRMDRSEFLTAWHIVNTYREKEIENILWNYGEEKFSRKIARAIVTRRQKKPIQTCCELSEIIAHCIGRRGRIHPATKTFQALRITVNRELEELERFLEKGLKILKKGGRLCIISYHSLEDRIVKHTFKSKASQGLITTITKKPITPSRKEIMMNPSSRSAKLRVAEKIG